MAKIHSTLILVAVFVLGIAAGVGAAIWTGPALRARLHPHPQSFQEAISTLHLTQQQDAQIHAILKETQDQAHRIRGGFAPRYAAIQQQYTQIRQEEHDTYLPIRVAERQKVRAVLDPQQQKTFDGLTAQWDREAAQHNQQMMQGHGPGHGPGHGGPGRGPGGPPPGGPGHFLQ